ncbi:MULTISPECIES: hypothetical protein [Aphanothece]|uniref:Nmad3 family putative nucleotide modification protein n=1 Tax=Aphanothece TaxID=1121 RepID=UPI003984FEFA
MKLILSRKGSDSSYGKRPSPIGSDGSMISIPIPEDGFKHGITYNSIRGLPQVLSGPAHLDPDLRKQARSRKPGWKPAFGQCDAALTHLLNQGVGKGDLFVFYGWFNGPGLPAKGSHVIWGWLQVGDIYWPGLQNLPDWLRDHPHACPYLKPHSSNAIYTATDKLNIDGVNGLPGAGTFDIFRSCLRLSYGEKMSHWCVPSALVPSCQSSQTISRHTRKNYTDLGDGTAVLATKSPGQEYVIDCDKHPASLEWILSKLQFPRQ